MAKKKKTIFGDNKVTVKEFRGLTSEQRRRILSNPSKRLRVVDAALPGSYRKKRQQARFLKSPITPGSGETNRELRDRRKQMEVLTFGDGDRELADRRRNQIALERNTDAWFRQYRDEVRAASGRAADASVAQAQSGERMVQGLGSAARADRDRVAGLLRDQAAQLGQTSQEANFRAVTDANIATRGAQLSSEAMAENAAADAAAKYAAARVEAAGLSELAERNVNKRRRDAISRDRKDYADKKGAWREKFIADAISEARRQVLEDRAAVQEGLFKQSELDLKRDQLRETRRSNRADEAAARERNAISASKGSRGGSGGGGKSSTSGKDPEKRFKRALATIMGSGIKPDRIVSTSRKGLDSKGRPRRYGVEWFIGQIIAQNKTEPISREVAKRAVYTYIKYKGRVPGGVSVKNAPKSPPWRR